MSEFDRIQPQVGAQTKFLSNNSDICIFGGAAGGGKSIALLIEPLRHIHNPKFGGVIFRREAKELTMEGGLVSKALSIYPQVGGVYRSQPTPSFTFASGARISFGHLNQETEVLAWKGSEICYLAFDEVDGFSEFQFDYMLSRNRSTCGVRPYVRASVNPNADSWVAKYLSWWIDQDTGYPIQEHGGKIRYLIRVDGERKWGSSKEELVAQYNCDYDEPKTVSFVPARIIDNPILLKRDPGYLANLKGMTRVERARLLDGNWKIRPSAGDYFPRDAVTIIDWMPTDVVKWLRSWDLAATEEGESRDPDWTVGLLIGRRGNGKIVIGDMVRVRRKADSIQTLIKTLAIKDGHSTWVSLPQDPGSAGKAEKESYMKLLSGFTVLTRTINKNKVLIASGGADSPAALWQRGEIEIVRGDWNKIFLDECDAFPTKGIHDDICDALSNGVRALPGHARPDYSSSGLSGRFKEIRTSPNKYKTR